jgi:membrane-bound metal-dependent hydrolase YbcI (DUF457 family)
MDPITHGIAGALIGKGFFSEDNEGITRTGRVAVFAATLGAVFPDIDTVADFVSRDPLAIVKYHRAITHSFLGLPFFAVLLAFLTPPALSLLKRRYPHLLQLQDLESPSRAMLTLIYGVGIASHILLDGMTSFGTRMLYPLSSRRVAWDLLFIIDLAFTSVILVPQVIAWICSDAAKSRARAVRMWSFFTIGAVLGWLAARGTGYPFRSWIAILASAIFAVLFFAPRAGGWGFPISRAAWCQAGTVAMTGYILACAVGHHAAILRAKAFADAHGIVAERMAALPIPPSFLDWGDAIRTGDGVYAAHFDLRQPPPPAFAFAPDSPPDLYIARAFQMPSVRLYWQFARFPSIHSYAAGGDHVVELGENRFSDGRRGPQPFTYEVVFDQAGNLLGQGWLRNSMFSVPGASTPLQQLNPAATGPQGTAR